MKEDRENKQVEAIFNDDDGETSEDDLEKLDEKLREGFQKTKKR
jgi:hypothetical protein